MTKKEKMRNLLCAGLNEVISQGFIKLEGEEDVNGNISVDLFGKKSQVIWHSIGYAEVRISVWWGMKETCKSNNFESTRPLNKKLSDAVDVCCSAWLERRNGFWLQGKAGDYIFDTYCAKHAEFDLKNLPDVIPNGYSKEGKFYF